MIKSAASGAKDAVQMTSSVKEAEVKDASKSSFKPYTNYDDSEIRGLISALTERVNDIEGREDKDTVYDDGEIRSIIDAISDKVEEMRAEAAEFIDGPVRDTEEVISNALTDLHERVKVMESGIDSLKDVVTENEHTVSAALNSIYLDLHKEDGEEDTLPADEEKTLRDAIETISRRMDIIEGREDKDTVYDDSSIVSRVSGLGSRITALEETVNKFNNGLSGIVDLTDLFKKGDATKINEAIKTNASKVMYVGYGSYYVNGTIMLPSVNMFICLGNIIGPDNVSKLKPMSEYWPGTLYRNDVMRSLVSYSGSNGLIYINKLTVRHNYCAFYVYYSKSSTINIGNIVGQYSVKSGESFSEYKSVFGGGGALSKTTRYIPITDDWKLNCGFMTDHIDSCTVNIDFMSNMNYGVNFIETIPDKNPDPTKWGGINFNYIEIQCSTFNFNSILCKKAINLDLDNAIEWKDGETVYVKTHALGGNNILGNRFNVNSFVAGTATRTNSVEIMNEKYYDQSKDNRRIMFNIASKSSDKGQDYIANNEYNVTYAAGVYDVVVNAKNISSNVWNMYVQVNDVYFCDSTSHAQRNKVTTTYRRGNSTGYDEETTVTCGPLFIFDNCYNCEVNNDKRAFIRPNEIDVKSNCNNIRFKQVSQTNSGDYWHRVLRSNYKTIQERIYEGSDIYAKPWDEGFEKI